jgi:hypothetical protein
MGQVECRAYGARTIGDLYGRRLKEQMGCFDPRFTMFARAAIAGARSPTQAKKNQKEGLNGAPNLLLPIIPPPKPITGVEARQPASSRRFCCAPSRPGGAGL